MDLLCKLFLFSCHVTLAVAISFVVGPSDVITQEGGTVTLQCQVTNKGQHVVYWRSVTQDIYLSNDRNFYVSARNPRFSIIGNFAINQYFLQIRNIQFSDAGIYECVITPNGTPVGRRAVVTVRTPPAHPQCTSNTNVSLTRVGTKVIFTCSSVGGIPLPSLSLLVGERRIAGPEMNNVISRQIRLEERHNGLQFSCTSTHPLTPERRCSIVLLRLLPTARIEPPSLLLNVRENAVFTCVAFGIPNTLRYFWFFNNEPFIPSENKRTEISADGRVLKIRNVSLLDDNASIKCQVSTINGLTASSRALLRVQYIVTDAIATNPTTSPETKRTSDDVTGLMTEVILGDGDVARNTKSSPVIVVLIVIGILIAQILLIIFVYFAHKVANRMIKRMGKPTDRNEAVYQDPDNQQTQAHAYEANNSTRSTVDILSGWTDVPRYEGGEFGPNDPSRYQSLHPYDKPPTSEDDYKPAYTKPSASYGGAIGYSKTGKDDFGEEVYIYGATNDPTTPDIDQSRFKSFHSYDKPPTSEDNYKKPYYKQNPVYAKPSASYDDPNEYSKSRKDDFSEKAYTNGATNEPKAQYQARYHSVHSYDKPPNSEEDYTVPRKQAYTLPSVCYDDAMRYSNSGKNDFGEDVYVYGATSESTTEEYDYEVPPPKNDGYAVMSPSASSDICEYV